MTVEFTTKAESNARREREFWALSGPERLRDFVRLSRRVLREYPSSVHRDYGNNFVLEPSDRKRNLRDIDGVE